MLIETDWLNMLLDRVKTKITPFKLTKCDLATAHLDTLVSFLLTGDFFPLRDSPPWARASPLSGLHGHTQIHRTL
jgi:hypothetical protein